MIRISSDHVVRRGDRFQVISFKEEVIHEDFRPAFIDLGTYQCQAGEVGVGGGGRWGIGREFDRSLWPWGRAFELSCCPGGRDI